MDIVLLGVLNGKPVSLALYEPYSSDLFSAIPLRLIDLLFVLDASVFYVVIVKTVELYRRIRTNFGFIS